MEISNIEPEFFSLFFGLICIIIGKLILTPKPKNHFEKGLKKMEYLKEGFKVLAYQTTRGLVIMGIWFVFLAFFLFIRRLL